MLDFLIELDEKVLLFFNGLYCQWADHFMMSITGRTIWIFFYVALAIALVWSYGWLHGLAMVLLLGLAVGCSDMIADKLIRPYIERLRPSNLENEISAFVHVITDAKHPNGYRSSAYGFPSCHAANTMALAVASCLVMRRGWYTAFIFIWAGLLCYSRIYLGVHFPGDIIVGSAIGGLVGLGLGFVGALLARSSRVPKRSGKVETITVFLPIVVGTLTFLYAAFFS